MLEMSFGEVHNECWVVLIVKGSKFKRSGDET